MKHTPERKKSRNDFVNIWKEGLFQHKHHKIIRANDDGTYDLKPLKRGRTYGNTEKNAKLKDIEYIRCVGVEYSPAEISDMLREMEAKSASNGVSQHDEKAEETKPKSSGLFGSIRAGLGNALGGILI